MSKMKKGGLSLDCVNKREQWENLMRLMERELRILESCNGASMSMQASLHARNWPELELALEHFENLTSDLEDCENRRQIFAKNLGGGLIGKGAAELPDELRRHFDQLKFKLKASLLRVKSRIHGMAAYTESRGRLVREMVEILVPSARGRIYNERGETASTSGDSLLVSRNL